VPLNCADTHAAAADSTVRRVLALEHLDSGRLLILHTENVHDVVADQQLDAVELE
jgi:hypothetical protein